MDTGNRGNRESGFFLKRGTSAASLRIAMTRLDALDRRLAHEVEEATAIDKEVGLVLMCLRLQLLSSATELGFKVVTEPFGVDVSKATDLIMSYRMAITDAIEAVAGAKKRAASKVA